MKLSILLAIAAAPLLAEQGAPHILRAIAIVESGEDPLAIGDGGKALGAWQMHPKAWEDANAFRKAQGLPEMPRSLWLVPGTQEAMAKAFLSVIQTRLARAGVVRPTASQIALCWNMGFAGAKARGFRPTAYSTRVARLAGDPRK
jgi:hypothetical protein